jgi:hypothetical protein
MKNPGWSAKRRVNRFLNPMLQHVEFYDEPLTGNNCPELVGSNKREIRKLLNLYLLYDL